MPLIPIKLPAGQFLNGTEYQEKGRWRYAQLIRWREGMPQPIGGWKKVVLTQGGSPVAKLAGSPRALLTWRDSAQQRWLSIGTTRKLFAHDGGALYDITPAGFIVGNDNAAQGFGYGADLYGNLNYGDARVLTSIVTEPAFWSLDTWGQNLIACANCDGKIWQWVPGAANALALTNAPQKTRAIVVANERFLFALGAGIDAGGGTWNASPRRVAWCDQESNTVWTPTSTNAAGDFDLDTSGLIQRGIRFQQDILIFTDQDVHRANYIGPPFIWGFHKVSSACGLIGPGAVAQSSSMVVWMGTDGFFVYDGYVRDLPCDVADYVFNDINVSQQLKVQAGYNSQFNEFWFFYPSGTNEECNKYVIYNPVEGWWATGAGMPRSAWCDTSVWPNPFATYGFRDVDNLTYGYLYEHENGYLDDSAPRTVFLETAPIDLGNGDQLMVVDRVFQDTDKQQGVASITFRTRNAPNTAEQVKGPYTLNETAGYTDVRLQGRQLVIRIDQKIDTLWHVGDFRINAFPGSGR